MNKTRSAYKKHDSCHQDPNRARPAKGIQKMEELKCVECPFQAKCRAVLKTHRDAVHLKLRPYQCTECPYASARVGTLNIHMESLHGGMKKYKCEACPYVSNLRSVVERHHLGVHEKRMSYQGGDSTGSWFTISQFCSYLIHTFGVYV